ncbi:MULTISPECIES: hypothetical protein [Vibrio]|uniref:Pili assembly chaperone N-terminal domain-containing protein n=1 Tax=Vibrio qingdaonensis TaxID=2829491 RepID=A0A9X3CSB5_9VIBR|nr:hypothetical protein [Vibrio qingdaonensis]MCW8348520.1 hypothetical protein [Vibrio qingdaonensis]
MRLLIPSIGLLMLTTSFVTQANVHKWKNTSFDAYSDKTQVKFTLLNRSNINANYFLRIDKKVFPQKIPLKPNEEIELDVTVNTPSGTTSEKYICTKMVSDSPNTYEVCTQLTFKRY